MENSGCNQIHDTEVLNTKNRDFCYSWNAKMDFVNITIYGSLTNSIQGSIVIIWDCKGQLQGI